MFSMCADPLSLVLEVTSVNECQSHFFLPRWIYLSVAAAPLPRSFDLSSADCEFCSELAFPAASSTTEKILQRDAEMSLFCWFESCTMFYVACQRLHFRSRQDQDFFKEEQWLPFKTYVQLKNKKSKNGAVFRSHPEKILTDCTFYTLV